MKDEKTYVNKAPMVLQYFIPSQFFFSFCINNIEDLIVTGSFPNTN